MPAYKKPKRKRFERDPAERAKINATRAAHYAAQREPVEWTAPVVDHTYDFASEFVVTAPASPVVRPPDLDGDGKPGGRLSKAEIMDDLDRLGIEYDARLGRDKLDAILRKDKAAREAAANASVG